MLTHSYICMKTFFRYGTTLTGNNEIAGKIAWKHTMDFSRKNLNNISLYSSVFSPKLSL
jgi:hypothetical protein